MSNDKQGYRFPPKSILHHYGEIDSFKINPSTDVQADILVKVFKQFGTEAWLERIFQGPTFRQYRFGFEKGTFNSSILKDACTFSHNILADDVRIIPPGPNSPFICVEVPNEKRFTVGFDCMVNALEKSKAWVPMALGMDVKRVPLVADISKMNHLLLLGDEGSGKTVYIHSLVNSILYSRTPDQVQLYIADCNFQGHSVYNGISHLLAPIITEPQVVIDAMEKLCNEMERRMELFLESGESCIWAFNESMAKKGEPKYMLPYIVFIMDEIEPIVAKVGDKFEYWIKRITAVAKYCGIHFVLSTKHADRNTVSQVINLNIPSKLYFRVHNAEMNYECIADPESARLEPRGDFIYPDANTGDIKRIQGAYIDSEISDIVEWIREHYTESTSREI